MTRRRKAIQEVERWIEASDIVRAFELALSRVKGQEIRRRDGARKRLNEELMRLQPPLYWSAYKFILSVDLSPEAFPALTAYQLAATHLDQPWTRVRDWCYALKRLKRLLGTACSPHSQRLFARRAQLALSGKMRRGAFLLRLVLIEQSYERDQTALEVFGLVPPSPG